MSVTLGPACDMSLPGQAGQTQGWWQTCRLTRGFQAGRQGSLQAGMVRQTSGHLLPGFAGRANTQGRLTEAFLRAPPLSRLVMEVAA